MKHGYDTYFGLRFRSRETTSVPCGFPSHILTHALRGLQQSIHIVAMMIKRHEINNRLSIPLYIKKNFHLYCQVSPTGEYYQPTFVAKLGEDESASDGSEEVVKILREIMGAVSENRRDLFESRVTDSAIRHKLVASLKTMFKETDDECTFDVDDLAGTIVLYGKSATATLDEFDEANKIHPKSSTCLSIVGHVEKIDFGTRKIFLRVLETQKLLEFGYEDKFEEKFLKIGDNLTQIMGSMKIDHDGNILEVKKIEEVLPFRENST